MLKNICAKLVLPTQSAQNTWLSQNAGVMETPCMQPGQIQHACNQGSALLMLWCHQSIFEKWLSGHNPQHNQSIINFMPLCQLTHSSGGGAVSSPYGSYSSSRRCSRLCCAMSCRMEAAAATMPPCAYILSPATHVSIGKKLPDWCHKKCQAGGATAKLVFNSMLSPRRDLFACNTAFSKSQRGIVVMAGCSRNTSQSTEGHCMAKVNAPRKLALHCYMFAALLACDSQQVHRTTKSMPHMFGDSAVAAVLSEPNLPAFHNVLCKIARPCWARAVPVWACCCLKDSGSHSDLSSKSGAATLSVITSSIVAVPRTATTTDLHSAKPS